MSLTWHTIQDPKQSPSTPGVYMYMADKNIIYIGKSLNLRARLASHAQSARHSKHERLIQDNTTSIRYTLTDSDFLATILEAQLITQHLPKYNRILRDNKSYLYIVINMSDDYPKPHLTRHRDLPTRTVLVGYQIYGPFATRKIAEDILRTIRHLIPFCQQKNIGKRACFYHKLGLCNPCPSQKNKVTNLAKIYRGQIRQITKILSGNITPVLTILKKQLKLASDQQNYELALTLRDRITRFESALLHRSFTDGRVFSYSNSQSDLQALSAILQPHLGDSPLGSLSRIEAYDASTFQLSHSVVSMVVATGGQMDSSQYRRFRIKNLRIKSDFGMLEEALRRRLKHDDWPRPDLLVIDGGRPQLRRLQPLLDQLDNPPHMIGLAKHPDKIILPIHSNKQLTYSTIPLTPDSPALHLLQRLRDESHRFANNYRKLLEKKSKSL